MAKTDKNVDLLQVVRTRRSQFDLIPWYNSQYSHHFPLFTYGTIDTMLRDSRIQYALKLIKGPIYAYTQFFDETEAEDPAINQAIIDLEYHFSFVVKSEQQETADFVLKTLKRFWMNGIYKALMAIEWGYAPCQVVYRRASDGRIEYDKLIKYSPQSVKPTVDTNKSMINGIFLRRYNKFIPLPKSFVHVHQKEYDAYTGRSRLRDAHIPWHETWNLGGARDIRRNWFFKNSYDSGTMYIPNSSVKLEDGTILTSQEYAAEMMEKKTSGSYMILPKSSNSSMKNDREWEYEPPKGQTTPQGMLEYNQDLRIEVLEGMGIPPEVVENPSSNGLGSSTGRKVPLMAFYASLAPIVIEVLEDFTEQTLIPLCRVNTLSDEFSIERIIPKSYDPTTQGPGGSPMESFDSGTDTSQPNPQRAA